MGIIVMYKTEEIRIAQYGSFHNIPLVGTLHDYWQSQSPETSKYASSTSGKTENGEWNLSYINIEL